MESTLDGKVLGDSCLEKKTLFKAPGTQDNTAAEYIVTTISDIPSNDCCPTEFKSDGHQFASKQLSTNIGEQEYVKSEENANNSTDSSLCLNSEKGSCNKSLTPNRLENDKLYNGISKNLILTEISKEETGFPDIFNGLVTIGKYFSVKGDFTLRSTESLVESPSLIDPFLLKEPDQFPTSSRDNKAKPKDFFHSAAGEILIGIGLSRVNEWFHRDMIKNKKRQIKKEGKLPHHTRELAIHKKEYFQAKTANSIYSFASKNCETCDFTTESSIIMEGHLLVPHITPQGEYQCNFCSIVNQEPQDMLFHMRSVHKKVGYIQPPVLLYDCPCCMFESKSMVKLNNHLNKCQKFFNNNLNQAPPKKFQMPTLTPKPIIVAVAKTNQKSLSSVQKVRGRPKKIRSLESVNSPSKMTQHATNYKSSASENLPIQNKVMPHVPTVNLIPANTNNVSQIHNMQPLSPNNQFWGYLPIFDNNHLVTSSSKFPFSSNLINSEHKKFQHSMGSIFNSNFRNGDQSPNSYKNITNFSIANLPKLQGPYPIPMAEQSLSKSKSAGHANNLFICEICDGYIKDLDQLHTHMLLIHKVKIHPKILLSRPPLNCQKCQWRFFTDQGLERHLLGTHGVITSRMQELVYKNKDAGCCTICGRVYASKFVNHMTQVHKIMLKLAHLSYKCIVCSATFNLYRLFENHVYLMHSAIKCPVKVSPVPTKRLETSTIAYLSEENQYGELKHCDDIVQDYCNGN